MAIGGRDRRRHPRINTRIPVKLDVQGKQLDGELWNLSVGGALVQIDRTVESYLKCDLIVPEVGTVRGVVLQGSPPISLQFHNVPQEQQAAIQAYLAKIAPEDDANDVLSTPLADDPLDGPL